MTENEWTAKNDILKKELTRLKKDRDELKRIVRAFYTSVSENETEINVNNEKMREAITKASTYFKDASTSTPKLLHDVFVDSKNIDSLIEAIYNLRPREVRDNPNLNVKFHRYKKRPNKGDIVKLYAENEKHFFAEVLKTVYHVSVYSDNFVRINEKLVVKRVNKNYNLKDVEFCLNYDTVELQTLKNG